MTGNTERGNINGQTAIPIMANGIMETCMDMAFTLDPMARNMKANLSMIREKDKVLSPGLKAKCTKDHLKTILDMAWVSNFLKTELKN